MAPRKAIAPWTARRIRPPSTTSPRGGLAVNARKIVAPANQVPTVDTSTTPARPTTATARDSFIWRTAQRRKRPPTPMPRQIAARRRSVRQEPSGALAGSTAAATGSGVTGMAAPCVDSWDNDRPSQSMP